MPEKLAYFGKMPNYFPLFLKSCKANLEFDFLVFTDDKSKFDYPENVQVVYMTFSEMKEKIQEIVETEMPIDEKWAMGLRHSLKIINNAPAVDITEEQAIDKLHETSWLPMHDKELTERPQDNLTETKHRLNLLIDVLFSNQVISENDIEYIEDSIKKLMEGDAE